MNDMMSKEHLTPKNQTPPVELEIIQGSRRSIPRAQRLSSEPQKPPSAPPVEVPFEKQKFDVEKQEIRPETPEKEAGKKKKISWKQRKTYSETNRPGYIRRSPIHSWFSTFMIMNIPIIGWIYLFILALSKKDQRKDFASAYLVYKLVFLLVALAIIALLLYYGMDAADTLLQYMNML